MTCRATIVLFFGLMLAASDALACSCIQIGDPLGTVAEMDAVFRARTVTTMMVLTNEDGSLVHRNAHEKPSGFAQRLVVLRVEEVFKGAVAPLTILVTGSGGGDCG